MTPGLARGRLQGRDLPDGLLAPLAPATGDAAALRARLAAEGYLYLPGLLPPHAVAAARAEVVASLRATGEIDGPDIAPVATGTSRRAEQHSDLAAFWRGVCEGPALRACVHHPALHALTTDLFDTPSIPFDFVWLRAVTAGRASPFHFDHPYMNRGAERLLTCWVPLGDVTLADGPIVLIEGSHRFDDLAVRVRGHDVDREPGFSGSFTEDMIGLAQSRRTRFLSADFRAGDVLVFGMFLLHGSLDNRASGGKVRLSADVRFQPAADARDDRWFGTPPLAHGGRSYGGLNGAQPLTAKPIAR